MHREEDGYFHSVESSGDAGMKCGRFPSNLSNFQYFVAPLKVVQKILALLDNFVVVYHNCAFILCKYDALDSNARSFRFRFLDNVCLRRSCWPQKLGG